MLETLDKRALELRQIQSQEALPESKPASSQLATDRVPQKLSEHNADNQAAPQTEQLAERNSTDTSSWVRLRYPMINFLSANFSQNPNAGTQTGAGIQPEAAHTPLDDSLGDSESTSENRISFNHRALYSMFSINWNASAFRAMNVKVLDETADSIWQDTAPQYLLSHNKLEES